MLQHAPVDPRIGTELAGHRIEAVIGRGGASVVYLAAIRLFAPKLANEGRELIRRALPRRGRREPGFAAQVTEAGGGA